MVFLPAQWKREKGGDTKRRGKKKGIHFRLEERRKEVARTWL